MHSSNRKSVVQNLTHQVGGGGGGGRNGRGGGRGGYGGRGGFNAQLDANDWRFVFLFLLLVSISVGIHFLTMVLTVSTDLVLQESQEDSQRC